LNDPLILLNDEEPINAAMIEGRKTGATGGVIEVMTELTKTRVYLPLLRYPDAEPGKRANHR
jgi:hypothetical protein